MKMVSFQYRYTQQPTDLWSWFEEYLDDQEVSSILACAERVSCPMPMAFEPHFFRLNIFCLRGEQANQDSNIRGHGLKISTTADHIGNVTEPV